MLVAWLLACMSSLTPSLVNSDLTWLVAVLEEWMVAWLDGRCFDGCLGWMECVNIVACLQCVGLVVKLWLLSWFDGCLFDENCDRMVILVTSICSA